MGHQHVRKGGQFLISHFYFAMLLPGTHLLLNRTESEPSGKVQLGLESLTFNTVDKGSNGYANLASLK